ncbi:MAG TPA: tRNA (adenosine(37)-N6)-threonylcarbamoyltransferase complex dimerization subunit type 1 TsaB [Rhodospirillales bacterium]|nr:tRNA (adenosine(37)-N6)-threonylcarbamoyltransferase complex dimerization subunit type 1 TsaB [Rhodospirillales bacterium]
MDSATMGCSVALWRDGDIIARQSRAMARGQSEALVPMIDQVLLGAQTSALDLDLIAVTRGPGAFTGLRIGLATARAMALAATVPCLGLVTTEVVARNVDPRQIGNQLLIALDTKRADFYVQKFSPDRQPLDQAQALTPHQLVAYAGTGPLVVAGDATASALKILTDAEAADASPLPDAARLAQLAAERWQPGQRLDPPEPLYLRPADAKIPAHGGRLRP